MSYIEVELKKTKYSAYYFDGTEKSAIEFCKRWGCTYSPDFIDPLLFSIVFPSKKKCYAGNYIVIDDGEFSTCTQTEFIQKYDVVYRRGGVYSFLSED